MTEVITVVVVFVIASAIGFFISRWWVSRILRKGIK